MNQTFSSVAVLLPNGTVNKIRVSGCHLADIGRKLINFYNTYATAYALVSFGDAKELGESFNESVFYSPVKVKSFNNANEYLNTLIRENSDFIYFNAEWYFLNKDNTLFKVEELYNDYVTRSDNSVPYSIELLSEYKQAPELVKKVVICRDTGQFVGYVMVTNSTYRVRVVHTVNGGALINPKTMKASSSRKIMEESLEYMLPELKQFTLPSGDIVYIPPTI